MVVVMDDGCWDAGVTGIGGPQVTGKLIAMKIVNE